jgi:hypothetical protein
MVTALPPGLRCCETTGPSKIATAFPSGSWLVTIRLVVLVISIVVPIRLLMMHHFNAGLPIWRGQPA